MPEIVRFKGCRTWRRPLLQPATKKVHPSKWLAIDRDAISEAVRFEKQDGIWIAAEVPRRLTWLRGLRAQDFRIAIENEGYRWRWL